MSFADADVEETRITCAGDCARFHAGSGQCTVARDGKRKDVPRSHRPMPDMLRHCEWFAPPLNAPDQRLGRERWPGAWAAYVALYPQPDQKEQAGKINDARQQIRATLGST